MTEEEFESVEIGDKLVVLPEGEVVTLVSTERVTFPWMLRVKNKSGYEYYVPIEVLEKYTWKWKIHNFFFGPL